MSLFKNAYACLSYLHLVTKLEKGLIRNKLFTKEKIRKNVFIKKKNFQAMTLIMLYYFTKTERLFTLSYL